MMQQEITHSACRLFLLLSTAAALTQCRPDVSIEREQAAAGTGVDTLAITSFNIERENTLDPAEWKAYEAGREVMIAPSNWVSRLDGIKLIITPPSSADSSERIVFGRYRKDSPTLDYNKLAQQIANNVFITFLISKNDKLKKAELSHDFFYERTAELEKKGTGYKGYCMVYVSDSLVYQYAIVLTQARLNAYKGDLIKDMVGNLQINHKYVMSNSNPVKKIVYIRP